MAGSSSASQGRSGVDGDVAQAPRGTETPPEVRLEERAVGVGQPGAAAAPGAGSSDIAVVS